MTSTHTYEEVLTILNHEGFHNDKAIATYYGQAESINNDGTDGEGIAIEDIDVIRDQLRAYDPYAVNAFDVLYSAYEQFGDDALVWGDDDEYAPVEYAGLHMGALQFCVKQEDGGYTYSAWEVREGDATPLIEDTWTVDPSEATRAAIRFFSDKKATA